VEVLFSSGAPRVHLYLNDEEGKPKKMIEFPKRIWDQLCGEAERVSQQIASAKVGSFFLRFHQSKTILVLMIYSHRYLICKWKE
jgi:hypothetical protein